MATLPPEFKIASVSVSDDQAYVSSQTRSKRYRSRKTVGQAYELTLRTVELEQADIKKVMAAISAIERDNDSIQIPVPILNDSGATNVGIDSAITKGDFEVDSFFFAGSGAEVGDFFNFDNHSKTYQVTSFNDSTFKLKFTPNLVTDAPIAAQMVFGNAAFNMKIAGRPQRYEIDSARNSAVVELRLIEVF